MKKKVKFYINNLVYTVNVDEDIIPDITRFLSLDSEKQVDTNELLLAYIRKTYEFHNFKKDIQAISDKLPKL